VLGCLRGQRLGSRPEGCDLGSDILALTTMGLLTCSADSLALLGFWKKEDKQETVSRAGYSWTGSKRTVTRLPCGMAAE
jgi:hypothetical protein